MSCWNLARGYPKVVTQITVHSAEGLEKKYANESKSRRGVWESKLQFHLVHVGLEKVVMNDALQGYFQSREVRMAVNVDRERDVNFLGQGLRTIRFYKEWKRKGNREPGFEVILVPRC